MVVSGSPSLRPAGRGVAIQLVAKAVPNLAAAAAVPALCFILGRSLWGLPGAIALALIWSCSYQGVRRLMGRPFSGLMTLGMIELAIRASVALALNSPRAYFIAPAIVTALTGLACVASAFTPTPLMVPVLADLVPSSVFDVHDPANRRLLQKASVVYGLEQILTAAVSIIMVLKVSTTLYAAVHPMVSWLLLGLVIAAATPALIADRRAAAARGGSAVAMAPAVIATPALAPLTLAAA